MKYKLRIRCEISQTDDYGNWHGQGLTVEETAELGTVDFMETAAILGRFHDVAVDIQAKQAGEKM